jgi:NADH:ubiquinone oxidoreductase subunit F (NADH-binding)
MAIASRNLTALVARHGGPSALQLLKEGHDVGRAAALSGLPEATVYGVSTFYDDLRDPHLVRACTGIGCWAATGGAPAREGLGETACLGMCHCAPAFRVGDVVDAGEGALDRVLAGEARPGPEPFSASDLDEPVLLRQGDYSGLARALAELTPEALLAEVKGADLRGRGGAGFPAGVKWELARRAQGDRKFVVVNGDEGDPGSYIDKLLLEQNPDLVLEGAALAGYAIGADHGFVYVRSEYPRAREIVEAAISDAYTTGDLGENIRGSGFSFHISVVEGAGSYVVGEETALIASLHGFRGTVSARPPYPAEHGYLGKPTIVNNVETLCNVPFIALHGAGAYTATKLVSLNAAFAQPGVYEVRFGLPVRELCERLGGGLRDGHTIKALQIGGPLGGMLPASLLDTPFDFESLAEVGCMLGHGSVVAFDERTDMRALARHLLEFGARESCGKCFPCRVGMQRAFELVSADGPVDQALLDELLETLEVASLCAHGSGMPAPIRSLIRHFPEEMGLA